MMFLGSKEPLMKRCLSTGGAVLLFKPIPDFLAESSYQKVIEAFGLSDMSPEDRVKALLSIPIDDLWQKVPHTAMMLPVVDGDTVPGSPDFSIVSSKDDNADFLMPGRKWCKALMIGESKLDVCNSAPLSTMQDLIIHRLTSSPTPSSTLANQASHNSSSTHATPPYHLNQT